MPTTLFSDGFESGIGAWTPNGSDSFTDTTVVRTGAQSMRVHPTSAGAGWQFRAEPLSARRTYRLVSHLFVPSSVVPTVHIALVWDFPDLVTVGDGVTVTDSWVPTELVVVAPAGANPANSYVQCVRFDTGGSTADDVYVDDVLLQDITPGPIQCISQYSSFH